MGKRKKGNGFGALVAQYKGEYRRNKSGREQARETALSEIAGNPEHRVLIMAQWKKQDRSRSRLKAVKGLMGNECRE